MKIKFDGHQDFQLDAIRAVVDVFAGQPLTRAALPWESDALGGELLTEMGVGNSLVLGDEAILRNVRAILTANEIEPNAGLSGLNFSVGVFGEERAAQTIRAPGYRVHPAVRSSTFIEAGFFPFCSRVHPC